LPRDKIARGEINPNIKTAAYLGDVVSGEHFSDYKAPPSMDCQTAIVHFRRLLRRINIDQELQGRQAVARGGKGGKNLLFILSALFCMCTQPDFYHNPCRRGL
jgi:hypothetical protein